MVWFRKPYAYYFTVEFKLESYQSDAKSLTKMKITKTENYGKSYSTNLNLLLGVVKTFAYKKNIMLTVNLQKIKTYK